MKHATILLLSFALSGVAMADDTPQILTEKSFSKEAFLSAMKPAQSEIRTRAIKIDPIERKEPSKPASASLDINFKTGSATLTPPSKRLLDQIAAIMKDDLKDDRFSVEGHTDSTGSPRKNQALSERRAQSVAEYLALQHNVEKERLAAVGKGSSEPLIPEKPAAPENRRVTFVNRGTTAE